MRNDRFVKGIQIIYSAMPEEAKMRFDLKLDYYQVWFGSTDWVADPHDIKTLRELKWFNDGDCWSFYV